MADALLDICKSYVILGRREALSSVIPGPRKARDPESSDTANASGFRVRTTQVGFSRLGQYELPISGKLEIGGAPRNDNWTSGHG